MAEAPPLTATTIVRQSEGQVSAEVDGDVVMLQLEKGKYFGLDDIGSDVWRRIEQPTKLADLFEALAEQYDAPPETIQKDVIALLEGLRSESLVDVVE